MRKPFWVMLALLLTGVCSPDSTETDADVSTSVYAIEINGTLCGFSEVSLQPSSRDGRVLKQRVYSNLAALGSQFESEIRLTYHLDESGAFTYHDSKIDQGDTHLSSVVTLEGQSAVFDYGDGNLTRVELPPGTLLENTTLFPHLVRDFVERGMTEQSYRYLEVRDAAIQTNKYRKLERAPLELGGVTYDALGLEQLNQDTGLRAKIWIDAGTGRLLKAEAPGNRVTYLADASIKKRLTVANLDNNILVKTNRSIGDYHAITYMKVRVEAHPSGEWVTPESLNVPGQRFAGTVDENRIRGVFEISHPRYGRNRVPPFPPDFSADASLQEFLQPDDFIESDDPVLAERAAEIVKGSEDSWEAATRLSRWVAKNVDYTIPGGVTARKTYKIRAGECGAHSFLTAAFCRSVGIPARVVWGAMYVPSKGGVFGQHAWNEIYMGEAGWIPIDATASEVDHVDSAHIRLSEYKSVTTALNPVQFEILDYRVREADGGVREGENNDFSRYLGSYTHPANGQRVEVELEGSSLVLNVVGKTKIALKAPNQEGVWTSKMGDSLFCTFPEDSRGEVGELVLHQLIRMPRTDDVLAHANDAIPEELRPYCGKFLLRQANAAFTVLYDEGQLAVNDPMAKKLIHLRRLEGTGLWIDEFDKNQIYFEHDDQGKISYLVIDSINRFKR